ncbi:MAG TPA: R3H domain-containing nucleic acid-binding protein [Thermoanaerobaculia bacterium]|jgi:spoIIIJ-associated protein
MRYEGKSEAEAAANAARALGLDPDRLRYAVVRDEKSFWGGRLVEIEIEVEADGVALRAIPDAPAAAAESPRAFEPAEAVETSDRAASEPATEEDWAAVDAALTELLSAAGFLVEIRRRPSPDEMVFELIGDDVEGLLANKGEGLNGLEVLAGRIASRRVGRPVHPRLDAEGFRRHQKETLEDLARRSADEAKRTRRPQLLPPLPPAERRLVHLALAEDPDVETESEGSGFLKRVAVRLKTS